MQFISYVSSAAGKIEICGNATHITQITFTDTVQNGHASALTERCKQQLQEYFTGMRQQFDIPFTYTAENLFYRAVWDAVAEIPYGETLSYSQIAEKVGKPAAVRAVATAIGKNRLLIVIPCHRVIGKDKRLHGFAAGLDRKITLLKLEQNHDFIY